MRRAPRIILSLVLALIAGLVLFDILGDLASGGSPAHLAVEALVAMLAVIGIALIWVQNFRLKATLAGATDEIRKLREDAARWRDENAQLLGGLGDAIDRQLKAWSLTEAESEIARLLLKGLSLKEIATVRNTSERTARQQSLAVYAKSGLAGRAELSAFFLEDLLAPRSSS